MTRRSTPNGRTQSGFSLMELLLVISVMALLLSGVYKLFDGWLQRTVDRQAAGDILRVQFAAEDYVRANFAALRDDGTTFRPIDFDDLRDGSYLPTGYQQVNAFRQLMQVYYRALQVPKLSKLDGVTPERDDTGAIINLTTIEVVSISANSAAGVLRIPNQRLLDTAGAGGPKMGVYTNLPLPGFTFAGFVASVFRDWSIPIAALRAGGYTPTADATGGYIAAHGMVNNEVTDANSQYLYRVPVQDRPDLNRMTTNLDLNRHAIQNVGTVVGDNFQINGNAAFRGQTSGTTGASAQAMTVEQALRVDGGGTSRINMKSASCTFVDAGGGNRRLDTGSTNCGISGGELQVIAEKRMAPDGSITPAGDARLTVNALSTLGNMITDNTNITQEADSRGISTFQTLEGRNNLNALNSVAVVDMTVNGNRIDTQQFQTQTLTVNAPSRAEGTLSAYGVSAGAANNFTTKHMDIGNLIQLTGNLRVHKLNATNTLYIEQAGDNYYDPTNRQQIFCHAQGARTYCEPQGYGYWQADTMRTWCAQSGVGYHCYYRELSGGTYVPRGHCYFDRGVDTSNRSIHVLRGCDDAVGP